MDGAGVSVEGGLPAILGVPAAVMGGALPESLVQGGDAQSAGIVQEIFEDDAGVSEPDFELI